MIPQSINLRKATEHQHIVKHAIEKRREKKEKESKWEKREKGKEGKRKMLQCHTKPSFVKKLWRPISSSFVLLPYGRFSKEKDKGTRNKESALKSKCHKINARHDSTLTAMKPC